ncbi:hypothetical protein [Cellulosilyticum ruminicola]|uniref:hypothetical protein n=1 Tax=Cellulosilyticum ruminicola TaxID=425254 RepID=UPI0006D0D130|nr:hypothetical protein [Cellulosilyticum ruminicola]
MDKKVSLKEIVGTKIVLQYMLEEFFDELAEQNLRRCDAICLKLFVGLMVVAAWMCAIIGHVDTMSVAIVGWVIVVSIMVISIV